jgi:tRNA-uridine aminocarboxypropyltransferase
MSKLGAAQASNLAVDDRAEYRAMCHACRRPRTSCYCALIEPFDSAPRFIILTQPREARHRLGTGRMAHLCLRNSVLLEGVDFSRDRRVNDEIARPGAFPFLLYPSDNALSLSRQAPNQANPLIIVRQRLVIFVLDGTWKSVRKMLRASPNLAELPRLCFEPAAPSNYRIRRQPRPYCYSTIEAIRFVLDWFAPRAGSDSPCLQSHHNLLTVFHAMVDRQLAYTPR